MKDTFLKIFILAFQYMLSTDGASYANTSSVTEECQLVAGVAEYSCAAMMLLVLATCAARGLRSAEGRRHVHADKAGGKVKAKRKPADYRINPTTHPSSKKNTPQPDYSENLTKHPSSKKETPVLENMTRSPGRSAVDQQRRRNLEVMENLDRLISLMSDDESDTSSELLLTQPRCQVHSQDQDFFSWSTSSTESSVSRERESRKLPSPRKEASDELETPEKQDIVINEDDYSGAIKKRKSDDQKRAVADMSQTQCEEVDFSALHNVVCGSHRRTTCDTVAQAGTSSQKVTVEVQAQGPESSYGSHRTTTSDAGAQTGTSSQKVTVEVQAQCPESSRDLDSDAGQHFGEVGLERVKESSQHTGSETMVTDSEADVFCFLHNVPQQPKRMQARASSTSKPKSTRNRFGELRKEAKDEVTPITVYSKKIIVSASKKGHRREPETEYIKLNKAVNSKNVHYMLSSPEEGAMMPHAQYYEELKNETSSTAMDSTNEASFVSNKDLSTEMTQRTQKFADEWVQEPTQWDLLYSFPHPLRNCESSTSKETDRCQSKASSYDDTGSCITGSNSSFERVADYILSLKPYERSSIVVEKSQIRTGSQLDSLPRRELENVQLLNDVNKYSRARIPEKQYNTLSTDLHKTNDDCVAGNRRERYSSSEMGPPGEQEMEGQNSSVRQRRDDHGTTAACQKSSSKAVKTSTNRVNYS